MEDDSRDGPPCIVKMTMKDITFWHVYKTLFKHDVKKQQSSNFKEITSGHYVNI